MFYRRITFYATPAHAEGVALLDKPSVTALIQTRYRKMASAYFKLNNFPRNFSNSEKNALAYELNLSLCAKNLEWFGTFRYRKSQPGGSARHLR